MKRDLIELISNSDYELGDRVYLNLLDSDSGVVVGYVLYEEHIEYLVMFSDSTRQVTALCLADSKPVI